MRLRIVVANRSEARFFDTLTLAGRLMPAGELMNPQARLHERDLGTERPGRVFNFAAVAGRRRGASLHHATDGERSLRDNFVERFARRIAAELSRAHAAQRFDRLVLLAAPAFLGRLRKALSPALQRHVAASVATDLIRQPDCDPRGYLTQAMFTGRTGFEPVMRIPQRKLQ